MNDISGKALDPEAVRKAKALEVQSIKEKGVYTFYTDSDDGSQLFIGDDLVVDNDGLHSMKEVSGSVALSAGHHPIRVTYFEKNGGNKLNVYLESMKIQKQSIPDNLLSHR